MQTITRYARAAACLDGYLDIDITNCLPNCILLLYRDSDHGAVRESVGNTLLWRRAVAEYYDISIEEAKEVLMCALYGFPAPRNIISPSPHTMHFVERLSEGASGIRDDIRRDRPRFYRSFSLNNRAYAEAAAFSTPYLRKNTN